MASLASSKTARTTSLAVVATDGELLMRFERHRDQAAFAEVVERHGRLVWIVCKQALGHHQDVEDAFQATFLILAQRATTIRASDSAAAWLYRVAQRTAIAARRRRSRLREETLTAEPPQGEEALPLIHDRQMLRVLMEELQSLPERYQTPLVMQYFEGQSRRAIAERTDSTVAQIQGRLVRGKRMLRSRLMRRGVSLSLATAAIATATSAANAAVSPSLVAATAASSSSVITSGATGTASPAAVELSKQGLNAMWYATLTKIVGTAAGVLIVAGVLLAAQSGDDGLANVTVGQAANGVDLRATIAAVAEENEPAEIEVAEEEPAKAGTTNPQKNDVVDLSPARQLELERDSWLLKAKAYRMKVELKRKFMEQYSKDSGIPGAVTQSEITEARADAMLLEADANDAEAKAIELAREAAARKANAGGADMAKEASAGDVKVFSLVHSDALDLTQMLQEQFGSEHLKFSADLRTNSIVATGPAKDLDVAEALLRRLDSAGEPQQEQLAKQRDENERKIQRLKDLSREYSSTSAERQLEQERLEQALLQRELDHLHAAYLQLNSPLETVPRAGENNLQIQGEKLETVKNELQKRIEITKAKLEQSIESISDFSQEIEDTKRERQSIERKLEYLEKANLQLEFPQASTSQEPVEARQLKASMAVLEADLSSVRAENAKLKDAISGVSPPADPGDSTLAAGDTILLRVSGGPFPSTVLMNHRVEEMGTIALGPDIGRIKVAGLSIIEAEEAIRERLAKDYQNPKVQVTMESKAEQPDGPFQQQISTNPMGFGAFDESSELISQRNMKLIALALRDYVNANRQTYPPYASHDSNGRPLLSWRVHLLPFLGHAELYRRFRQDQPWDSPHNKLLIGEMPVVFQSPELRSKPGLTAYLAALGEGLIFDGSAKGSDAQSVGPVLTIAFVEAESEKAVIWSKPDDLNFNPSNPLNGLRNARRGGFLAATVYATVGKVPQDTPVERLRANFTKVGEFEGSTKAWPAVAPVP